MFIELQRGRSFGGLTRYCLGPGEAQVDNRVEFVETCNLATRDAEAAWRVMAARHYLQDELKAQNGIRTGNRGKPVGHMFISWGAEEAANQNLDREAMVTAARGALKAIGAEKHQAIVIAHNDTADNNPHCHVIVNLIGDDGRLKNNTDEKKKLSRFALEHETLVHGEPVVRSRYQNWQDRDAGETPTSVKKKARHLYELEKAAEAGDIDKKDAARMLEDQRGIEQRKERFEEASRDHLEKLRWCRDERIRHIEAESKTVVRDARTRIRKGYREYWQQLYDHQFWERGEFNANEQSIRGSIENAIRLVDWKSTEKRGGKLARLFNLVVSERARREEMAHRQQSERDEMRRQQREAEASAKAKARTDQKDRIATARKRYVQKSEQMKQRQEVGRDRLKKRQQIITKERNAALSTFRIQQRRRKKERAEERQYIAAMKQANQPEKDDSRDEGTTDTKSGPLRRPRRERDPRTSRRKRQQRGETGQEYQERRAANQNQQSHEQDREQ